MKTQQLELTPESIKNELKSLEGEFTKCVSEYIWNAFDAHAQKVKISFDVKKISEVFQSVENFKIEDDGRGWDFDDEVITNNFMSSTKKRSKAQSLPHGHLGRGRYAFIWFCESMEATSLGKLLILDASTKISKTSSDIANNGTSINFNNLSISFQDFLQSDTLKEELVHEFCWFLLINPSYEILINGEKLDINSVIERRESYPNKSKFNFTAEIIIWRKKPAEYSKFYYINNSGQEICKKNTGLNNKADNFWHSAYIRSDIFDCATFISDDACEASPCLKDDTSEAIEEIAILLRNELELLRRKHLAVKSDSFYKELKKDHTLPDLKKFGIQDESLFGTCSILLARI